MENEKMYTTTELAEITGLSRKSVLRRARQIGYKKYCKYVLKRNSWGNYIKEFSFTESQVKAMEFDHYLHREKEEEAAEKNVQEKFEEMKREHPLVTDKRCFTLSWFPETIPFVMNEEEE